MSKSRTMPHLFANMSSRKLRRAMVALALTAVFAFAVDSMWLFLLRNTYMSTLAGIRDIGPRYLPGSNVPIRVRYSGIPLLDYWFAVMQTILANVTDGSAPRLSLYAFHFAGQLGSVVTILMMEGMRYGNKHTLVSWFMPWGLLMTAYGYAVIMPIYGLVHLVVSSTTSLSVGFEDVAKSIEIPEYPGLFTLPEAIILGYGLPVMFMALPIFSTDLHQLFVAGWHLFPIWVSLSHFLLELLNPYATTIMRLNLVGNQDLHVSDAHDLERLHKSTRQRCLSRAYTFAYRTSAFTHILTFTIILTAKAFPSMVPINDPHSISWTGVFLPDYWRSTVPMQNFVQGTLNLLQYDQYSGSLSALVWGLGVYELSVCGKTRIKDWVIIMFDVTAISALCGPGAALSMLMARRDRRLREDRASIGQCSKPVCGEHI